MAVPATPPHFAYVGGELQVDGASVAGLVAAHGSPAYVYSATAIADNYRAYDAAMKRLTGRQVQLCFAVKALPTLAVLKLLGDLGCGADVVSGGELLRARAAGIPGARITFAGVGKSAEEIALALEGEGVLAFNVESEAELEAIDGVARAAGKVARVSLRVNPDVEAHTHVYITTGKNYNKFGIPLASVLRAAKRAAASPALRLVGLHCHIGSQLLQLEPFEQACAAMVRLAESVERESGAALEYLNLGGGLGVPYRHGHDATASPAALADTLQRVLGGCARPWRIVLEPGRWLVANAGALVTRVTYVKPSVEGSPNFAIVDAAMNDLIRPALYQAHHDIVPARLPHPAAAVAPLTYDVVGPVCETGDFLGRGRQLPALAAGDVLAVLSAGAYGSSMASNYNSRGRAVELLVERGAARVVRRRETFADLVRAELDAAGAVL